MLEAVIVDSGCRSIAAIARDMGIPVSTAHRQVKTLAQEGYLTPVPGGRYAGGRRLLDLLHLIDDKQLVTSAAAPLLDRLAAELNCIVQLGTLENEMVTYRLKTGRGADDLFTRIGMQLEAYCSGMGKVLLAHLPRLEREAYLAGGPFVALTSRTIVAPDALHAELTRVRERGYAIDDGEVADDIFCVAVPIVRPDGSVVAALSASQSRSEGKMTDHAALGERLSTAARRIAAMTGSHASE